MSEPCLVCTGNRFEAFYPGITKCQKCGFVFADLNLTDDDFGKLYQQNYFFNGEYSDYLADERILRKNFRLRLKALKKFIEPRRHKRLLEIGSAYGFFLDEARELFGNIQGIDIAEGGVRYAREALHVNAIQGDFLAYDFNGQTFDVVCLWDTIEHLRRPDLYLEKLGRYTEKGALIAVTTGDIESFNARVRKGRWRLIHAPTHAHYFSKRTLSTLLARFGFDVVYSRYCGFYRSLEQAAHSLLIRRQVGGRLFELLRRVRLTTMPFYINLYDIIYVIARRR